MSIYASQICLYQASSCDLCMVYWHAIAHQHVTSESPGILGIYKRGGVFHVQEAVL